MEYFSSTKLNSSESFTNQHPRRRKASFLPAQSEKIPPQMWTGFALSATWNEVIMLRDWASIRSIYSGTSQQGKMYYKPTLPGPFKHTQNLTCDCFLFVQVPVHFMQISSFDFLGSCKLTANLSYIWQLQAQTMSQGTALFSCGLMGK